MLPHNVRLVMFGIIVCTPLLLTSCWDSKEIDRRAYVVALGLDVAKDESNRLEITFLIVNPAYGPQDQGGGDEAPREIISFIADDFISAGNTANTVISKEMTYDALGDIIISEELAQNKDFVRFMYDASKDMEVRRDVELIISKEDAYTFLVHNKPIIEKESRRYFKLIRERGQEDGMIPPDSQLMYYSRITEAGGDLFLGTYATTESADEPEKDLYDGQFKAGDLYFKGEVNSTQFAGAAVFKNGQMIGTMTGEETHISALLNNTLKVDSMIMSFPDPFDPRYRVSTRINKQKNSKVTMHLTNGTPTIEVSLPIIVDVLINHSMTDYSENTENVSTLQKSIEKQLEEKINRFIKRTQEEFKGNPFGWSLVARKQFLTNKEYEQFNWMEQYPNMDVHVNIEVKIGRFGRQSVVPKLKQ